MGDDNGTVHAAALRAAVKIRRLALTPEPCPQAPEYVTIFPTLFTFLHNLSFSRYQPLAPIILISLHIYLFLEVGTLVASISWSPKNKDFLLLTGQGPHWV